MSYLNDIINEVLHMLVRYLYESIVTYSYQEIECNVTCY